MDRNSSEPDPGPHDYKISITRSGPITHIHATRRGTVYCAQFTPSADGSNKARDDAIASLIEMICGFSKSEILIAIYDCDHQNVASAIMPELGEAVEILRADEDRDGPVPFGG